jgi:hypothetical protein
MLLPAVAVVAVVVFETAKSICAKASDALKQKNTVKKSNTIR